MSRLFIRPDTIKEATFESLSLTFTKVRKERWMAAVVWCTASPDFTQNGNRNFSLVLWDQMQKVNDKSDQFKDEVLFIYLTVISSSRKLCLDKEKPCVTILI